MTQDRARSRKLLGFYPKAYREERGEEIVATMQEAADALQNSIVFCIRSI